MLKRRIHLIDSDPRFVQQLREQFLKAGFEVSASDRFKDTRFLSEPWAPHLIVLTEGEQTIAAIRKDSEVPVFAIAPNDDVAAKLALLEAGADDCLAQPLDARELVVRVKAILRRWPALRLPKLSGRAAPKDLGGDRWHFKGLVIELNRRRVLLNNEILELTTAEFDLLKLFVTNVCEVLTRDTILDRLRGISWDAMDRSVDILVSRLRTKLRDDPKRPRFIQTIRSMGYQFIAEPWGEPWAESWRDSGEGDLQGA